MEQSLTLGEVIRTRRVALGLTQEELAERIGDGVRQAEVSRLERGRVTLPRRKRLERIAAALEVPLGRLLASAGWSDAERAFVPSSHKEERARAEQTPTVAVLREAFTMETADALRETVGTIDYARLRAAVETSRMLLQRTEELITRSQSLALSWRAGELPSPPSRNA